MRLEWVRHYLTASLLLLAIPSRAHGAASLGLPDLSQFTDPSSFLSDSLVKGLVKTVGLLAEQRPYEPATPQGVAIGLEFGIEATLMQSPKELSEAAGSLGGGGSLPAVPLPMARLQLHKGMGESVDVGGSIIYVPLIIRVWGADVKVAVFQPEEGPTFAVRMCFSSADITQTISGVVLRVGTLSASPQILMSRKIAWADPYIGIGATYVWGNIYISAPTSKFTSQLPPEIVIPPGTFPDSVEGVKKGNAYGAMGFVGVAMRIPRTGLRLTLEGGYSPFGTNTLGTKIGFNF